MTLNITKNNKSFGSKAFPLYSLDDIKSRFGEDYHSSFMLVHRYQTPGPTMANLLKKTSALLDEQKSIGDTFIYVCHMDPITNIGDVYTFLKYKKGITAPNTYFIKRRDMSGFEDCLVSLNPDLKTIVSDLISLLPEEQLEHGGFFISNLGSRPKKD
jgi:hypothetical protein